MQKKKLYFIAFLLMVLLSGVIYYAVKSGNSNDAGIMVQSSNFKSNKERLVDFGENVVKYGKMVYILDDISNYLLKYDSQNSLTSIVRSFDGYDYGKKFFIRNNKLIYSYNNATYYSDLDGNHQSKIIDGEIVFINDEIFIYIKHNTNRDELYITTYNNLRPTNDFVHNLASGSDIKLLKASDDVVYFTCNNTENRTMLFQVDLKNSKVNVINMMQHESTENNTKKEYSNIIKTNNNLFYVVDEISLMTDSEQYERSYLYIASVDSYLTEFVSDNVLRYLAYNPNNKNQMIYLKLDDSLNKYVWKNALFENNTYNWRDFLYGDVTYFFSVNGTSIYRDGEELVDLNIDLSSYSLNKVVRLKDGYYFLLEGESDHMWYFCKEYGDKLTKIY